MPIPFKSQLTSAGANATFLDKTIDDIKTGKLTLRKSASDPTEIDDAQVFINEIASINGINGESDPNATTYSSEVIIANGDDRKVAIGKLDAQVATNQTGIATNASDISTINTDITNNKRTTYANEAIAASGEVTVDNDVFTQVRRVSGDGAAVTASNTPFGDLSSMIDGVVIILRGTDSTNTVTFTNNDVQFGMILNGNITLGQYDELEVMWDSVVERLIEQRRNK